MRREENHLVMEYKAPYEGREPRWENLTSYLPKGFLDTMPVEVVYVDRPGTQAESLLGVGLYSCTDYGTAFERRDPEALEAKVRDDFRSVQACKVTRQLCPVCGKPSYGRWYMRREDNYKPTGKKIGRECGHIAPEEDWRDSNEIAVRIRVSVHRNGYTPIAQFADGSYQS